MNSRHFRHVLLIGIAVALALASYESCQNNNKIVRRKAFTGSSFWNGRRLAHVVDCAVACVRRKLCMGFNYDEGEGLCELFGALSKGKRRRERSEYKVCSFIGNWTSEVDPTCFSRPCSANAVCMPVTYSGGGANCSYTCFNFTTLCPKPSENFSGPRSVGSTFSCGSGGKTPMCLDTLEWNETCTQ